MLFVSNTMDCCFCGRLPVKVEGPDDMVLNQVLLMDGGGSTDVRPATRIPSPPANRHLLLGALVRSVVAARACSNHPLDFGDQVSADTPAASVVKSEGSGGGVEVVIITMFVTRQLPD